MQSVSRCIRVLVVVPTVIASTTGLVKLNNGVQMPQVSLGTAGFDNATVEEALVLAVDAVFVGVDTAFNYDNQVGVGNGLKKTNRSAIFLTTKTTDCLHHQISDVEGCSQHTRAEVESDFAQLDVEYIDLLLLHGANTATFRKEGMCDDLSCGLNVAQWRVYEEYYKAGKVRAIGVSNYCPSCLECLLSSADIMPTINQLQFHVGMTADPQGLMSYNVKHGIVPMAYSPMGAGSVFEDSLATEVAQSHGKTSAQVALKWIVDKGYTLATKTNSRQHLKEDLDLFAWNLTDDEQSQLDLHSTSSDFPSWACTSMSQTAAWTV